MNKKEKIRELKSSRGITLIALVVTIVVLIILAGLSINLILGQNGIIEKAKQAKQNYEQSAIDEETQLNESYDYMTNYDLPQNSPENPQIAGTPVEIPNNWYTKTPKIIDENGNVKTASTNVTYVIAVADGLGNTIPVPDGFFYVGGNLSSGVVISDKEADKNKYAGYEADGTTVKEVGVDLVGNQFVWIPCTLDGANGTIKYEKKDFGGTYANAGWDNQTDGIEEAQIRKYSGFYIARYEAGLGESGFSNPMQAVTASANSTYNWGWQSDVYTKAKASNTAKPTSKANEIPWYHADYFTAIEMSKRMYTSSSSVSSGLVTGTMWDIMVQYIASSSEYTSSGNWGNYNDSSIALNRGYYTNVNSSGTTDGFKAVTSGQVSGTRATNYNYVLLSTGASDVAKRKNIYDVAGNLWEWTTESSYVTNYKNYSKTNFDVNTHLLRGGSFDNAYGTYPACFRGYGYAARTSTLYGFRPVLYIK